VVELQHVDARVAQPKICHNLSGVTSLTHVQKLTYKDAVRVRVRCVLNAKHTHHHRTPQPWEEVSIWTSKAWDEVSYNRETPLNYRRRSRAYCFAGIGLYLVRGSISTETCPQRQRLMLTEGVVDVSVWSVLGWSTVDLIVRQ